MPTFDPIFFTPITHGWIAATDSHPPKCDGIHEGRESTNYYSVQSPIFTSTQNTVIHLVSHRIRIIIRAKAIQIHNHQGGMGMYKS